MTQLVSLTDFSEICKKKACASKPRRVPFFRAPTGLFCPDPGLEKRLQKLDVYKRQVLGGLCAYPVAIFLMGKSAGDIAFYAYIVPFLISTGVGAVIAGILVFSLQRSGVLRSMQSSLS